MTSHAHVKQSVNIATSSSKQTGTSPVQRRQKCSVAELSQALFDFVVQLLPTAEELTVKEDVRKLLERLIRTIEPDSRLLSFGSTANGFSLRNSDMDLCCIFDSEEQTNATSLVMMVGDLLVRETKFHVKPLPHARIPIVKLSLDPSPGLPHGIACDIGFENRLAIENTRLLLCYSSIDPTRVRTLVLFLKVWSKRRKVNSPYKGTLSSYGYVLLVIYFLVHVKNPPVLPNLQQIPPLHPTSTDEFTLNGRNIWFFDDIDVLRQRWQSSNTQSVGELLIEFFRFYAREFTFNMGVASIRAGLLKKSSKGWQNDNDPRIKDPRERNCLCIEDPFELDYNVARCVTKDGLYQIRGEFMRASRILTARPERAYLALAQLCEEREEIEDFSPSPLFIPPRFSMPPQTPYSIGSSSFRPRTTVERDRLSPPRRGNEAGPSSAPKEIPLAEPPHHMAPKRSKWTSPPPQEAPDADRSSYENRLGLGLSLATAASEAREREKAYLSSSSNSEIVSDDGDSTSDIALDDDDVHSVRSFHVEPSFVPPFISPQRGAGLSFVPHRMSELLVSRQELPYQFNIGRNRASDDSTPIPSYDSRGRKSSRSSNDFLQAMPPVTYPRLNLDKRLHVGQKSDLSRRSTSGPSRSVIAHHSSLSPLIPTPHHVPLPPSPVQYISSSPVVVYETSSPSQRSFSSGLGPGSSRSVPQSPVISTASYLPKVFFPAGQHPSSSSFTANTVSLERKPSKLGNNPALPKIPSTIPQSRPSHSHTLSSSTIVAPTTPCASTFLPKKPHSSSQGSSPSSSPLRSNLPLRPSLSPHLARRPSLGQTTSPIATSSLGTPSPPSSDSSRAGSVGSLSPISSTSPQIGELGSPISSGLLAFSETLLPEHFAGHRRAQDCHTARQPIPSRSPPSTTSGSANLLEKTDSPSGGDADLARKLGLIDLSND